ncbi:ubiquitin-related domain-containing protein [Catenaria anguillulae PL171]|uniref:Ubiquitin-related domain-containing protein n=1 Tax=Catenaria anguillulae PL171 TaxID=765915 RepID=A0A1Y2HZ13_9FUNG|nr:ubiquitin-related domain-containing protein [Catenaria anguillulae PL171]
MQLFIRTLTGETKSICLTRDDEVLVDQLKDAIWVLEGISPQDQRLIHGGKQLKDGRCLMRDYKISNESTIRLVLRLPDEQKVVELVIKTLTGRRYSISLNQDICVGQLRDAICVYEGTPPDQMRLNLCGKQLEEGRFLVGDYNVADKTELLLVLRLRGC